MRSIPQDGGSPSVLAQESRDANTFDVVTVADMTLHGDIGFRIAGELRAQAEAGYRSGLLHLESGRRRGPPSPGPAPQAEAKRSRASVAQRLVPNPASSRGGRRGEAPPSVRTRPACVASREYREGSHIRSPPEPPLTSR